MIYHIIQSYFSILLPIGTGAILILVLGLYWILKKPASAKLVVKDANEAVIDKAAVSPTINPLSDNSFEFEATPKSQKNITITSNDISAIAGEDILSTQLDLARAYIETGRKQLAKKILDYVAEQGNDAQQNEARKLLGLI